MVERGGANNCAPTLGADHLAPGHRLAHYRRGDPCRCAYSGSLAGAPEGAETTDRPGANGGG